MSFLSRDCPTTKHVPSLLKKHKAAVLTLMSLWVLEEAKGNYGEQSAKASDPQANSQVKVTVQELCSNLYLLFHRLDILIDKHLREN